MRSMSLAPFAFFLSMGAAVACGSLPGDSAVKQSLLAEVNALRASAGLSRLSPSRKLQAVAEGHACDMAERGYFSHVSPDGGTFKTRIKAGGYDRKAAVENIAITPRVEPMRVVQMWLASPSHRANLLRRDLKEVGFGAKPGPEDVLWVMVGGAG